MKLRKLERKQGSGSQGMTKTSPTFASKLKRGRPPNYPQTLQDFAELGMNVDGDDTENKDDECVDLLHASIFCVRVCE